MHHKVLLKSFLLCLFGCLAFQAVCLLPCKAFQSKLNCNEKCQHDRSTAQMAIYHVHHQNPPPPPPHTPPPKAWQQASSTQPSKASTKLAVAITITFPSYLHPLTIPTYHIIYQSRHSLQRGRQVATETTSIPTRHWHSCVYYSLSSPNVT